MWATLATAATTLLAAHSSAAFTPPDCIRAVPAHTQNGDMVVGTKKPGLWLASATGSIKRQLTTQKGDYEAHFSPDGRKIVFQRFKKTGHWAIFTYDLRSGRTRQVYVTKQRSELAQAPVWSPDRRWIAFVRETDKGDQWRFDIALVRPNGKGLHNVHRVSSLTNIPTLAWSRNGACFAYQWGDFGSGALAIQNHDFTAGVNLIPFDVVFPDGAKIFVPESVAFSADGSLLYVMYPVSVNGKNAGDRIYAIRMDQPALPILIAKHSGNPVESPDGRWITYTSDDRWTHIRKTSHRSGGRRLLRGIVWDWAGK
jgi:Tol biopolymer transport system component